ncbi:MAG: hypothetical protein LKJ88_06630 [Bacilli bacterium]|jgi:hypothetical protein|nr:hypothetical protein [Bacilli bacterium]
MGNVILDFSANRTITSEELLSSPIFLSLADEYIANLKKTDPAIGEAIVRTFGEKETAEGFISFLKRLYYEPFNSIKEEYMPFTDRQDMLLDAIDGVYDCWREKERYAEIDRKKGPISAADFISQTDSFSETIIGTYRKIYENVLGHEQTVYRQLPSGVNAGLLLDENVPMSLPKDLSFLKKTPCLDAVLIRPPFICKTSENTRTGTFFEKNDPLTEEKYFAPDYRGVAILIKGRIGYIFIHKDYISFLVALGNLFKIVSFKDVKGEKPDFIIVFGADVASPLTYYYQTNNIYVGLCPLKGHIAYFGYLKKIILTLHNLKMIDEKKLPIHGAAIEVSLKNGKTYNIVILGDSGAGKSETIETVKRIGTDLVSSIKTIYDDMGTFSLRDGKVMTNGTETGAFVRLDDLDKGFSLRSVDRAIYLNIEQVNSRVVVPIETYETSKDLHKVDVFLLADNFTPDDSGLKRYTDKEEAESDFIKGARMAKGTTSEKGLVTSFFANPFGPVQREEDCRPLIDMFFNKLFKEGAYVGRLYTKLALDPIEGPVEGAKAILQMLEKLS